MKPNEIREWSAGEIEHKIASMEEELFNLRFQSKLGQLANPLRLRLVRKDIARAKTILAQKNAGVKQS
jgi:large subunit ribosomal protein L29